MNLKSKRPRVRSPKFAVPVLFATRGTRFSAPVIASSQKSGKLKTRRLP